MNIQLRSSFLIFFNITILLAIDMIGILISINCAYYIYSYLNCDFYYDRLINYYYLIFIFPFIQFSLNNYQIVLLDKISEFKKYCFSVLNLHLAFLLFTFLFKEETTSRVLVLLSWQISFIITYNMRLFSRVFFSRFSWWGSNAFLLGAGDTGNKIYNLLISNPYMGLNPKLFFDKNTDKTNSGIPIIKGIDNASDYIRSYQARYGILCIPSLSKEETLSILDKYADKFIHFIIIPDLYGISSLWVTNKNLGGHLGLEINHKLIENRNIIIKRFIDLIITIIGGLIISPVLIFIALLVGLTSKGPILYSHKRIGKNGKYFNAYKFRTMKKNADIFLNEYLDKNPMLKQEWEEDQKLKYDPRVTFFGRILRKLSIDEFPQLINIIRGEMSLVGPRPIVDNEIEKYKHSYELYKKVKPGMTGLWQISGRNNTTYEERVNLDTFYVRNWSVMLDIYILWNTISVVLLRKGAY